MSLLEYFLFCCRSGVFYFPPYHKKDTYVSVLKRCLGMIQECKCRQYHDFHSLSLQTNVLDKESLDVLALQLRNAYGVQFSFNMTKQNKGCVIDITLLCFDKALR